MKEGALSTTRGLWKKFIFHNKNIDRFMFWVRMINDGPKFTWSLLRINTNRVTLKKGLKVLQEGPIIK